MVHITQVSSLFELEVRHEEHRTPGICVWDCILHMTHDMATLEEDPVSDGVLWPCVLMLERMRSIT